MSTLTHSAGSAGEAKAPAKKQERTNIREVAGPMIPARATSW